MPEAAEGRVERARLGARSAARDLLRLVRALDARGVRLETLDHAHRAALEVLNQELAETLSRVDRPGAAETIAGVEESVAEAQAQLRATRNAILERLGRPRRREVLEAMIAVHVADEDLAIEPSGPSAEEIAGARQRAARRAVAARRSEARRHHLESLAVERDAPSRALLARLPRSWLVAIAENLDLRGAATPVDIAAALGDPAVLARQVEALRPAERAALASLLRADGLMLARALEARFGDASGDGFDWHRQPPTSVVGRLRARGLCVVGRAALVSPRSRPRVVLVPRDLRRPLAEALAGTPPPSLLEVTIPPEVLEQLGGQPVTEADAQRFERFQPELCAFAAGSDPGLYYVLRVWAMYEAAHPGLVPRLRTPDLQVARDASERDLEAVEVMHEKLLERRVGTMVAKQPHLYAYLARSLDELPGEEDEKLEVFRACDAALRAFDAALEAYRQG